MASSNNENTVNRWENDEPLSPGTSALLLAIQDGTYDVAQQRPFRIATPPNPAPDIPMMAIQSPSPMKVEGRGKGKEISMTNVGKSCPGRPLQVRLLIWCCQAIACAVFPLNSPSDTTFQAMPTLIKDVMIAESLLHTTSDGGTSLFASTLLAHLLSDPNQALPPLLPGSALLSTSRIPAPTPEGTTLASGYTTLGQVTALASQSRLGPSVTSVFARHQATAQLLSLHPTIIVTRLYVIFIQYTSVLTGDPSPVCAAKPAFEIPSSHSCF